MKRALAACVVGLATMAGLNAHAVPVVFSGSSGSLAASASFDIVAGQLQVTLSNTSTSDVMAQADVLTAVFFNVVGNPALTRISGISGGPTNKGTTNISPAGTVVGGEWAYLNGLSQYGANAGISSSGLGIFGPGDVFPGADLAGPPSGDPDGIQYGLTSAGDNLSTGNPALLLEPLTQSSATFLLGGLPALFSLSDIGSVTFQYGTGLREPSIPGVPGTVPEPATLGLVGLALVGLAAVRKRKA